MATLYSEVPGNWDDAKLFLCTDKEEIIDLFFQPGKLVFYDCCSFRFHSKLAVEHRHLLLEYFRRHKAVLVLTRTILMELATPEQSLHPSALNYLKQLREAGLKIILLDEELLYEILGECFNDRKIINQYLCRTVKRLKSPAGTIARTLEENTDLANEIRRERRMDTAGMYPRFFRSVRKNKESGDDLGEEILAVCLNILTQLPHLRRGKLWVLTDDRGAASKIDSLIRRSNQFSEEKNEPLQRNDRRNLCAQIGIRSTPRLIQNMLEDGVTMTQESLEGFLSFKGTPNINVKGTGPYDIEVNQKISYTIPELAEQMLQPGKIHILF